MNKSKQSIVLITGASSGIGEATARRFDNEGYRLILIARRKERLERLGKELKGEPLLITLDLRDRQAVEKAITNLPDEWKEIDLLVNNAGLGRGLEKLHEGNPDAWGEMIDTNIKGLLYISRVVIPGMVERKHGHIINIGSIAGHQVYPSGNVYCATKHAVNALTQGMMIDLVDTPIRVSTVDPGLVETEFSDVRFYGDKERAKKTYQGYKPLEGDDIADAVFWISTRPPHVQVAQVLIFPTAQAGTVVVHREKE